VRIGTRQRDASCDKQAEHSEEDNAQVRHRGEARKGKTQKGKEVYTSDCMLLILPSIISWKSRMAAHEGCHVVRLWCCACILVFGELILK
jgi:hypothetical protein